jgi:uncharacterized protein (DUF1501 family)
MQEENKTMNTKDPNACREYNELSRRQFLGLGGRAALLAALGAPAWLPRVAYASNLDSDRDVIVAIFLRGGADGLTLCVPHGEQAYYTARPTLAIPRPDSGQTNRATDLNGFFGLPPALTPLLEAYNAGRLLIVHATGSNDPTRSHFDAMKFMELGKPADPTLTTGWLGRHLLTSAPVQPEASLRAIAMSYGMQTSLTGAPKTLPLPSPDGYYMTGYWESAAARRTAINTMYNQANDPLTAAANDTLATMDMLRTINVSGYQPAGGAVYPSTSFGRTLKSAAALIKAEVGVEAIATDIEAWDTHSNQGPVNGGTMASLMTTLANGLQAFHRDIYAGNTKVTVVVMTEFGRRIAENGSLGSDHGHGGVMFVMGQNITGGRVLTNWPGLQDLYEDLDLKVTIDYRDILAEIVQNRLGNPNLAAVFPNYTPTFRGVTTP